MSFIKDIISRDLKLSSSAIKNLIKSQDKKLFCELCENAQMIFPNVQQRIVDEFVKNITKEDLKVVFEFSSIFCEEFQDIIVKSWLKFACEDLTDDILNLFENGTNEQKAYCALYFQTINDLLALEYLKKYADSEFSSLKINCARALSVFNDVEILNKNKQIILNSQDEFEKYSACEFICAYGGNENIKFILQNCKNSPFLLEIVCNILNFSDFFALKEFLHLDDLNKIYKTLVENYPENLDLSTIAYYQILDFVKYLDEYGNDFSKNLLLLSKKYFSEFAENSSYTFDLDKNTKEYLNLIIKYFSLMKFEKEVFELNCNSDDEIEIYLLILKEYNLQKFSNKLIEIFNSNSVSEKYLALCAEILFSFGEISQINKKIVHNIQNENIKAMILNFLNL